MKPKEKAAELLDKFFFLNDDETLSHEQAKQCALKAVYEIGAGLEITIDHLSEKLDDIDRNEVKNDFVFWQNVKQELRKL